MASTKKTIPELTAITIVNGEFLLVIHDGTSTKKIKVSDFVQYIVDQNAASGGGTNPGGTAPENPENGKTTWIDTSNPASPSLKLYLNNTWVDLTAPDAGDMLKSVYDPTNKRQDIFAYVDTAIRNAMGTLPSEQLENFATHIASTTVHVTTEDKGKWNTAYNHVSNATPHASAEEKESWNNAYNHVSSSGMHVTAEEKTAWDNKVTPEQLAAAIAGAGGGGSSGGSGSGVAPLEGVGHNAIYRGQKLGESVTTAQWSAIASGEFTDMYIGDYWEIGGIKYRIAAFDYYLHTGGTEVTKHHVTIVPDTHIGDTQKMNDSATTDKGYQGSKMYTTYLSSAKTTIQNAFGSTHILSHKMYFSNAVSNGRVSGASEYDSTIDLMSEINVYGSRIFSPGSNGSTIPAIYQYDKSQYPLFAFRPDLIMNQANPRKAYWLRDVVSATHFAYVNTNGHCTYANAGSGYGVRPAFSLIGD